MAHKTFKKPINEQKMYKIVNHYPNKSITLIDKVLIVRSNKRSLFFFLFLQKMQSKVHTEMIISSTYLKFYNITGLLYNNVILHK